MAIITKIHANNTKKSVIDKLGLKVGVHDVQWIEFEFTVKKCYIELRISTDHTWTDSKTVETEKAIQNAMEQCRRRGSDFGLEEENLRELVKWKLVQLHQYTRRCRESGAKGLEPESSSSSSSSASSAPYDPVRDCK